MENNFDPAGWSPHLRQPASPEVNRPLSTRSSLRRLSAGGGPKRMPFRATWFLRLARFLSGTAASHQNRRGSNASVSIDVNCLNCAINGGPVVILSKKLWISFRTSGGVPKPNAEIILDVNVPGDGWRYRVRFGRLWQTNS
jgi:hypothetical protein